MKIRKTHSVRVCFSYLSGALYINLIFPLRRKKRGNNSFVYFLKNSLAIFKIVSILPLAFGAVAQLVRAPPCHGGGREFEPRQHRH